MPRIRTFKPEFFKSEDVAVLPFRARLTWLGLWTQCDDHGRYKDSVRLLKGDIWSLDDVSLRDIEEDLAVLAAARRIVRYEVEGKRYLAVVNWHAHQAINRPGKAKHPAPPVVLGSADATDPTYCPSGDCAVAGGGRLTEIDLAPTEHCDSESREAVTHGAFTEHSVNGVSDSGSNAGSYPQENTHGGLTEHSRQERKGKERKGGDVRARAREQPPAPEPLGPKPPTTCQQHRDDPDPPACRRCQAARQAGEAWEAERRRRIDTAPKCPHHRGQPAHNCAPCRADRLAAA